MRVTRLATIFAALPITASADTLLPGLYTNAEDAYFTAESKREPLPWLAMRIAPNGRIETVDSFGDPIPTPYRRATMDGRDRIAVALPDGRMTSLRRARPVTCWGSVPKATRKANGGEDWYFASSLRLHDQGGRTRFGGGTSGAAEVVLKMRNVIWPTGTNRPSLVLYVHKPDNPDRAEAYSWADPGTARIGINLRWMQASCTIDGMETTR